MIAWSMDPVFTAVWTILLTRQYPTTTGWIGCALILIAVLYGRASEKVAASEEGHAVVSGPEA
jgi:drug/metabolite transporter (DMT)-like permease